MAPKAIGILVADDNEDDVLLLQDALEETKLFKVLQVTRDGEETLAYLRREGRFREAEPPGLVLLDINMPKKNGLETLEEIKADSKLRKTPVVVLTISGREEDIIRSYAGGACTYVRKPGGSEELQDVIRQFSQYWALAASLPTNAKSNFQCFERLGEQRLVNDISVRADPPSASTRLLLIEDSDDDALMIRDALEEAGGGFELNHVNSLSAGLKRLAEDPANLVLLDLVLPDSRGLDTLVSLHEKAPTVPIVVLTGNTDESLGVEAVRAGAQDFLPKAELKVCALERAVRYAIERHRMETQRKQDEEELARNAQEIEEKNAELEERNAQLAASNHTLEEFAYVASHDLQEPLRMVSSFTTLLAETCEGKLDQEERRYMQFILDGSARMKKLIDDLLSYSRAGNDGMARERVDCSALVQEVVQAFQNTLAESGGAVVVEELPTVIGDEPQLFRVFQNLIGNALKFRGASPPQVSVSAHRQGEQWLFEVRDNGIGISTECSSRVFKMFQRLHSPKEYKGTGIGLAITKKIVEAHEGKIWLESTPGQGTTFYFTLPVSESKADTNGPFHASAGPVAELPRTES